MNRTELVFILDMSGSMAHLTDDTVGGFNSILKEQSGKEGEVLVTTYLFNNDSRMIHDRVPIREVPPMTEKDYRAGGCTALLDAIGDAIHHIVGIHRYARKEDLPEQTLFVITTDGMENASHRYSSDEVKAMVEKEKAKHGWEFLFLGANIDAVETAARFGIGRDRAVNFHSDSRGQALNYKVVSEAVCQVRCHAPLGADWKDEIEADFWSR
jgi:uncharacterized protein YegL